MTTKRINSLEDLREEKRMLKLEKDATERLLINTLGLTKDRLIQSVTGNLLPSRDVENKDYAVSSAVPFQEPGWMAGLLPLIPVIWRFIRKMR